MFDLGLIVFDFLDVVEYIFDGGEEDEDNNNEWNGVGEFVGGGVGVGGVNEVFDVLDEFGVDGGWVCGDGGGVGVVFGGVFGFVFFVLVELGGDEGDEVVEFFGDEIGVLFICGEVGDENGYVDEWVDVEEVVEGECGGVVGGVGFL